MLLELRVSNFGIIEQIDWHLGQGLNVITGETGAGKSLVIDAVETLLSGKADESIIRYGAEEAFLDAVFDIKEPSTYSRLHELLTENGLMEPDEDLLIISAEIRRQGRSIFRVNGKTVSRGILNRIGSLLVDIHGQSEHLSLLNRDFQLDFLDAYAHTSELRSRFSHQATRLFQIEQELRAINEQEKEQARQEEFLRFQIDELKNADLKEGEEEALEKERSVHASSEDLKAASHKAYLAIYGDDSSAPGTSALEKLSEAVQAMRRIAELDDTIRPKLDNMQELESTLADIASDLRNYRDSIEYSPQRLQEIELRIELIRDLKRKYGQTITEILNYLEKAEKQLAAIGASGERRKQLEEARILLKREMGEIAGQLSRKRTDAAQKLMTAVGRELKELNMPQVKFEVLMTSHKSEDGITFPDGNSYAFTKDGVDIVEFMSSTNPGEPLKPLAAIASTGEMSRCMIALKSALAEADKIPVLIFDEIDIGVGGRSGAIVAKKLHNIAAHRQAICITHLPQIAVFADRHYSVHKEATGNRTISKIELLQGDEQFKEIALMLGGPQHTEITIRNARELIEKADAWKKAKTVND